MLGVKISPEIIVNYFEMNSVRIQNSKRKSLPCSVLRVLATLGERVLEALGETYYVTIEIPRHAQ